MNIDDTSSDDDRTLRGFVRLRPNDEPLSEAQSNPLHVGEWELPGIEGGALHSLTRKFEKDGDPVAGVEAFALAMKLGVYPPTSVLQWVGSAFNGWLAEQGKASMDTTLGLSVGRGQTPPYKTALLRDRDDMLMLDMDRLTHLGASQEQAAAMICARLEGSDWNQTKWELGEVKAETLIRQYAAKKSSRNLSDGFKAHLNDPVWVREWLKKFDRTYMPEAIKSRL